MAGLQLSQIRTRAKRRADMENSQFLADAEWDDLINEAGSELHDLIIQADPTYFRSTTNISVVANTETYSLSALSPAFYKLQALYWLDGGNRVPLRRFMLHDLDPDYFHDERRIFDTGRPYLYDILGTDLFLAPNPTQTGTLEMWYLPQYVRKSSDTDTFDYPIVNGWETFIIATAAIKAKTKEETDTSALEREKLQAQSRFLVMADKKDNFNSRRMRDAYGTMRRVSRRYI